MCLACRAGNLGRRSALNFEIFRRCFASIRDLFVFNNLTFIQAGKAGLLDSGDVNEHVLLIPVEAAHDYEMMSPAVTV